MRLAMVTMGTLGDVHPLLGLGQAMAARGHHVTLMCNPVFEAHVLAQGLHFVAVGTAQQQADTLAHPKMWHPMDGMGVMWRYMLRPALMPTVHALDAWHRQARAGEQCLALASPLAMGARLAAEAFGLPLVSAYTAASLLRTHRAPMTLLQWQLAGWVPPVVPRAVWAALDRLKLQPLMLPTLNTLRHELGLPELAESVFGHWMHSPKGGLALFPDWFAPLATDWPGQIQQGGFPLFDDGAALNPELLAFLGSGPAPVVVTPGTGQVHGAALFRAAAQALNALGLRGVFLGPVPADVVEAANKAALWCGEHQPFVHLLPQARAVLHHAGVGSSAQALRAGIPQLLWPLAYDQFDNAMRLERLGVAQRLPKGVPTAQGVAQALDRLLVPGTQTQAKALATKLLNKETGLAHMCQQLEEWV